MDAEFRLLFSERFGCAPNEFEQKMFSKSLFWHARLFTWLIRNKAAFFREDLEMLREVATARNTKEVVSELNRFYGRNRRDKSFLRTRCFLRVSGKRVLRIYRSLASKQQASDLPQRTFLSQSLGR